MSKLTIAGTCVFRFTCTKATIVVNLDTGLIEGVIAYTTTADIVVPDHFYIFPGFVDIHIHGREDLGGTQNYKETYYTAGEAAINGGVVAAASMPNLPVPPATKKLYLEILALAQYSPITIVPYAAISHGSKPIGLKVPYKGFLAESVNDLKFTSEQQADETLRYYSGEDVSLHCDDNEILAACKNEPTHEKRRPASSEAKAIAFAIEQHRKHNFGRLKIVHCSTSEGLDLIRSAREEEVEVFVEATPHHVFAYDTILNDRNRTYWQMNPPLRSFNDREAILEALSLGTIDALATDHAPHTIEEKALEIVDGQLLSKLGKQEKVASGVPMLDTYGAFVTWLLVERGFSPERVSDISSRNPGMWLNQFLPATNKNGKGYGYIAEGYIGSLTIIDPKTPTKVERAKLKTKCGWSPFEDTTFPGRVSHTIVRGIVYEHA